MVYHTIMMPSCHERTAFTAEGCMDSTNQGVPHSVLLHRDRRGCTVGTVKGKGAHQEEPRLSPGLFRPGFEGLAPSDGSVRQLRGEVCRARGVR